MEKTIKRLILIILLNIVINPTCFSESEFSTIKIECTPSMKKTYVTISGALNLATPPDNDNFSMYYATGTLRIQIGKRNDILPEQDMFVTGKVVQEENGRISIGFSSPPSPSTNKFYNRIFVRIPLNEDMKAGKSYLSYFKTNEMEYEMDCTKSKFIK